MDTDGLSQICSGLGSIEEDDEGNRIGYSKGEYCLGMNLLHFDYFLSLFFLSFWLIVDFRCLIIYIRYRNYQITWKTCWGFWDATTRKHVMCSSKCANGTLFLRIWYRLSSITMRIVACFWMQVYIFLIRWIASIYWPC